MFCVNCGHQLNENDIFCSACGAKKTIQADSKTESTEAGAVFNGSITKTLIELMYSTKVINDLIKNCQNGCRLAQETLCQGEIVYFVSKCFDKGSSFVDTVTSDFLFIITDRRIITLRKGLLLNDVYSYSFKKIVSIRKEHSWHSEYGHGLVIRLENKGIISVSLFSREAVDIAETIILKKMNNEIIDSSVQLSYCPIFMIVNDVFVLKDEEVCFEGILLNGTIRRDENIVINNKRFYIVEIAARAINADISQTQVVESASARMMVAVLLKNAKPEDLKRGDEVFKDI